MLPKEQLLRLSHEQEKTLLKSQSKLEQLKKFKSDYQILSNQLITLPDKLEYKMMIPFSKKAFIPGKLVRTNELLVLLGENWFIECSAKYASEIVKRRIEEVDKQIGEESKEHDNVSSHLKYTKEFSGAGDNSDIQEIVEFENELGEVTTIRGPNLMDGGEVLSKEEQARAIAKFEAELEELERIEQSLEANTAVKAESDPSQLTDVEIPQFSTAIHRDTTLQSPTILFHHSNTEVSRAESHPDSIIYTSPADVYDKSPHIVRKSQKIQQKMEKAPAKKVTWGENTIETLKETPVKLDVNNTQSMEKAFTNVVKERNNPIASITELTEENRIISKFKSSRAKSSII